MHMSSDFSTSGVILFAIMFCGALWQIRRKCCELGTSGQYPAEMTAADKRTVFGIPSKPAPLPYQRIGIIRRESARRETVFLSVN